jgi:hypothetical protein
MSTTVEEVADLFSKASGLYEKLHTKPLAVRLPDQRLMERIALLINELQLFYLTAGELQECYQAGPGKKPRRRIIEDITALKDCGEEGRGSFLTKIEPALLQVEQATEKFWSLWGSRSGNRNPWHECAKQLKKAYLEHF